MKKLFTILPILILSGCSSIPTIKGKNINRDWKTPFFSDSISADTVSKETNQDGSITLKATNYKHDTTVAGWGRTITAEEAEFELSPKKD